MILADNGPFNLFEFLPILLFIVISALGSLSQRKKQDPPSKKTPRPQPSQTPEMDKNPPAGPTREVKHHNSSIQRTSRPIPRARSSAPADLVPRRAESARPPSAPLPHARPARPAAAPIARQAPRKKKPAPVSKTPLHSRYAHNERKSGAASESIKKSTHDQPESIAALDLQTDLDSASLKKAIILREILGPPKALDDSF